MLFGKEKMYFGTFCREISSDIIQMPTYSYENYLQEDNQRILTKDEYEAFNNELPNFRLILFFAGVLQKLNEGFIKNITSIKMGKTFGQALKLAYEDNKFSEEEITLKLDFFINDMNNFLEYLETKDEEKIKKEGFMFHASMYFSTKFDSFKNNNKDNTKHGIFIALTNNNRKIIKKYFEGSFKKVKFIDKPVSEVNNKNMTTTIEFTFEFNQFLSKLKTNFDQELVKLDDSLLIVSLASFCARFFFIADDRQFYLVKSYLLDLFSSEFNTKEELYSLGVSDNIFSLISNSFTENENKALVNLFGKGDLYPFNTAPVIVFGGNAHEDNYKPISIYQFIIKIENNSISYKFKMPLVNPTKILTPLALSYMIEFVYLNLKQNESFYKSKKVMLDLLALMNDRKFSEHNLVNGVLIKNKII
ncbi:MAG TPA: hypothetical protein VIK72_05735 [Clostridiaceae bacterium]